MPIMPRKSSIPDPDIPRHIAKIQAYIDRENSNVLALSKAVGVGQSDLARFLNGERKTVTDCALKVLDFIHSQHNKHKLSIPMDDTLRAEPPQRDLVGLELISAAVMELWDGERRTATVIASLITALKPACNIVMAASSQDATGS